MPTDDDKPTPRVQVKERERFAFPELQIATETAVETTVAIEVASETTALVVVATDAPAADPGGPPDLGVAVEDTYVPDDAEQRLLYHWLVDGPEWRADIVVAPPPPDATLPAPNEPVVAPLYFPQPRQIGFYDDGVRRMLRVRE